jgi:hypothetical protein
LNPLESLCLFFTGEWVGDGGVTSWLAGGSGVRFPWAGQCPCEGFQGRKRLTRGRDVRMRKRGREEARKREERFKGQLSVWGGVV